MKLTVCMLLIALTAVNGFIAVRPSALVNSGLRTPTRSTSFYMSASNDNNYDNKSSKNIITKNGATSPLPAFAKTALAAVMCAASLLAFPTDSFAARSGGRSGGSSFRSAPSRPMQSTSRGGGGGGYSGGGGGCRQTTSYVPSPVIIGSPFGYSPFGYGGYGGGFGFSPFSFINPQVLFLGFGACTALMHCTVLH
jgi:hypothetical protein